VHLNAEYPAEWLPDSQAIGSPSPRIKEPADSSLEDLRIEHRRRIQA
jgi:hypothetical protein